MFNNLKYLLTFEQLMEAKKAHDECSDEIDSYHEDTLKSLKELKKCMKDGASQEMCHKHLNDAMASLNRAVSLAKNWNVRCG
jgi:uncharacterized coiled-coil DUF342 family protein